MASSSRASRAWPFILNWLSKSRSGNLRQRDFEEYVAGIGMLQVNEERRGQGFPILEHATIITGIHKSPSDPLPHLTIAAATREMKARSEHIVVHSRVTSHEPEDGLFQGVRAYSENIRKDDATLRASYVNPVPVRVSLISNDCDSAPVGCTFKDGAKEWYVLDTEKNVRYLEADKFYRVGEGRREYLAFWNPVLGKPCRAIFLGNERPEPHSPDPQPTNLESNVEHLSIAEATAPEEWVEPYVKLGKGKELRKPVHFLKNDGTAKFTSWEHWERIEYQEGNTTETAYRYVNRLRYVYWAKYLPAQLVVPWRKDSSDRPIRFDNGANVEVKTKRKRWFAGLNDSFYVYLEEGVFYIALSLPSERAG